MQMLLLVIMMAFVYARRYLDMLAPSNAHTHVRKHSKACSNTPTRPYQWTHACAHTFPFAGQLPDAAGVDRQDGRAHAGRDGLRRDIPLSRRHFRGDSLLQADDIRSPGRLPRPHVHRRSQPPRTYYLR